LCTSNKHPTEHDLPFAVYTAFICGYENWGITNVMVMEFSNLTLVGPAGGRSLGVLPHGHGDGSQVFSSMHFPYADSFSIPSVHLACRCLALRLLRAP